ncbi:hypothetical protein TNCV_2239121 [Trichonephila clavipes]|nr:hypothetical protein TNCV_2239121 [Trichonephila clavipes]
MLGGKEIPCERQINKSECSHTSGEGWLNPKPGGPKKADVQVGSNRGSGRKVERDYRDNQLVWGMFGGSSPLLTQSKIRHRS